MAAIAAVAVGLWDIKGRVANLPLYRLLGGASRERVRAYGHANGRDVPELLDSVRQRQAEGYQAIRVQTGVPTLRAIYGIAAQGADVGDATVRYDHEPARRGARPVEEDWDTGAYLRHLPGVFDAVRQEFGPDLPLLHDGHHRMTPIQAARLGKDLEPYDLFWLEDCTPAENQEALRLVRSHTTTPLAIGEVFNSVWDYRLLFQEQLIDYARSSVTHAGGISHLRKILDLAALHQIKSGLHGPQDISPVGMAAALHLGLAIHNFGIQEYARHGARTNEAFRQSFTFTDGLLHPGSSPGLGVTLDVDAAGRYPYQAAHLPIARLRDGTLHDW